MEQTKLSVEEIIEANKMIAEFMGMEGQHEEWCGNNVLSHDLFLGTAVLIPYEPNKSWGDLMPVVEKIEQLGYDSRIDTHNSESTHFVDFVDIENNEAACVVRHFHEATKLETVWQAVVEFIIFHNTKKQINGND